MIKIGLQLRSCRKKNNKRVLAFLEHPIDGGNNFSVYYQTANNV